MSDDTGDIQALISQIARLPGLGPRSARRIVLQLIRKRSGQMAQLAALMAQVADNARECAICGNITERDTCAICQDDLRATGEQHLMGWLESRKPVVVAEPTALEPTAIDRTTAASPHELPKQQAAVAYWLSKKYRVAAEPLSVLSGSAVLRMVCDRAESPCSSPSHSMCGAAFTNRSRASRILRADARADEP